MPYERKQRKLTCRGMNWTRPIDSIPDDQFAYLLNVRAYTDGELWSRPGLSLVSGSLAASSITDYIHSISTLQDYNPDTGGGSARFVGFNDSLYWQDGLALSAATLSLISGSWSGDPQSHICMTPEGSPVPFMYVFDSAKQRKYSPEYQTVPGTPDEFTIGINSSYVQYVPAPTVAGAGNLDGAYNYRWVLRDKIRGISSVPGPASFNPSGTITAATNANPAVLTKAAHNLTTGQSIVLQGGTGNWAAINGTFVVTVIGANTFSIPVDSTAFGALTGTVTFEALTATADSLTIVAPNIVGLSTDYVFDLYRFGGTVNSWRLVGSVVNNGSITDNLADIDLLAADELITDPALMRFQPFVTRDIDRQGTATVGAASATDGSSLTSTAGDQFNTEWVAGTQIIVNEIACTVRRIQSATVIYLEEDIGALGAGQAWSTTGALQANTALARVWGPYGAGQSGLYLFACGDRRSPGTLYWTNGNDPDTTSLVNSLDVTSPSEPLQNGCIWNGRAFVWSTDNLFEISPDLSTPGQFTVQKVPGGRGLFAPWCFAVGDRLYWFASDGGWAYAGGIPQSITDDQLYPFFGHDAQNGFTQVIPNPENYAAPITHYSPDPTKVKTWRLCWADGILYFDYVEFSTAYSKTLVFDTHLMRAEGTLGGWSMDIYAQTGSAQLGYVSRYFESGMSPAAGSSPQRTLLVGIGSDFLYMTGVEDDGTDITSSIMTGADYLGDNRTLKQLGDAVVSGITNSATPAARILINNNTANAVSTTLTASGAYTQNRINITDVTTLYTSRTVGLWLNWTDDVSVRISDWEITWLPRPEVIGKRPTDWTDDNYPGSKYLMAVVVDAEVGTKDTGTDLAIHASNPLRVSSATYNFVSADVGAVLQITAGTNWTQGTYIIQSITGTDAILDHSPGAVGLTAGTYILSNIRAAEVQYDGGSVAATIKLNGPGRYELPYSINPPIVGREFRLVPIGSDTCQLYSVHYIWEKYPDYLKLEEDYDLQKWPSGKYIRGLALEGDTQGAAVQINVLADGATIGSPLSVTQSGRTLTTFAFSSPFVANELKLVPLGSWRRFTVRWIYDEYPDFAAILSPWEEGGTSDPKYIREARVRLDTAGSAVTLTFWADNAATSYTFSVNSNGQKEVVCVFEPPVVAQTFRWEPNNPWRYFSTTLIADRYADLCTARTGIFGPPKAKYVRGVRITADSANVSRDIVVQYNGGIVGPTCTGTWNGKQTLPFAFATPFVAYEFQLVPSGNIRIFQDEIEWIYDEYPDLISITTPWSDAGTTLPKYIRSGRLRIDTNNLSVTAALWADGAATGQTFPLTANGQQIIDIAITPIVAKLIRFVPASPWRYWGADWEFDPYPSLVAARTKIYSPNGGAAMYVQGVRITGDSSNVATAFNVLYDGGQLAVSLSAVAYNGKQTQPYSFAPFIAHNLQLVPTGAIRIFEEEVEWIWEPVPEIATRWETQQTNHDIPGWHSLYDAWIAYQSAPGAAANETLTITTEYGTATYSLPVSTTYARAYLRLAPQKAKWRKYTITSTLGCRVFVKDCAIRVQPWGAGEAQGLISTQPFGDLSRNMGARI